MKFLPLLTLPLFILSSCKSADDKKPEEENTTWKDKSAREKLDSMNFSPVLDNVSRKIDGIEDRVNSVMLTVNYDDAGNMWLTGLGATDDGKVKTIKELSGLLSVIGLKGDAGVSHVYEKVRNKVIPDNNSELENIILKELRKQGFRAAGK